MLFAFLTTSSNLFPFERFFLIDRRYPFAASPQFVWLNSVSFVTFVFRIGLDFFAFVAVATLSQVIDPSCHNVSARSTYKSKVSSKTRTKGIKYHTAHAESASATEGWLGSPTLNTTAAPDIAVQCVAKV